MRKIVVTRIGALFQYSIPRAVFRSGRLERFFTDVWAGGGWGRKLDQIPDGLVPSAVKRLRRRYSAEIPNGLVTDFPGMWLRLHGSRRGSMPLSRRLDFWVGSGGDFCRRIIRHGVGGADAVYTTNTQGLELLRHARARGLRTLMEQTIAPYAYERKLLDAEYKAFPGWEEPMSEGGPAADRYVARESDEWAESDLILCGSEFVRDGIAAVGGPAEKCVVVPYGFDLAAEVPAPRLRERGRLHVLTLGTVCLRKGIGTVYRVAEALHGRMEFRAVGPSRLFSDAQRRLSRFVDLPGAVPYTEVWKQLAWADVLLFPSICEGSATVTYEALASGVPVVCTPNTGSVVRDGIDGFLVEPGDVEAFVRRLEQLDADRDKLASMSASAIEGRQYFSLHAYTQRLDEALSRVV